MKNISEILMIIISLYVAGIHILIGLKILFSPQFLKKKIFNFPDRRAYKAGYNMVVLFLLIKIVINYASIMEDRSNEISNIINTGTFLFFIFLLVLFFIKFMKILFNPSFLKKNTWDFANSWETKFFLCILIVVVFTEDIISRIEVLAPLLKSM